MAGAALLGATMLAGPALATQGYFPHAFGLKSKGMAGSDVAFAQSAMTIAVNPAGLSDVDDQLNVGVTAFSPNRKYSATPGAGFSFVDPAGRTSKKTLFAIPNFGVSKKLSDRVTVGFALYAAGGMNTTYSAGAVRPSCLAPGMPSTSGVFCGGKAGIDLMQVGLSPALSYKISDVLSVGIAPIFSISRFKAEGLAAFGAGSTDAANLSNRGYDWAFGVGGRAGFQVKPSEMFSFGAYYQSRIYMSKFKKYRGLFAEQGDFDIPASAGGGIAFKPSSALTLTGSYKHVWYSKVKSIGNAGSLTGGLGANNGAGFGWKDVDVFAVGAQYDVNDKLTVRAGYSYNNNPIGDSEVMFNILAPAVVKHHFTGGFSYDISERVTLDFAGMFAPSSKSQGTVVTAAPAFTQTITDTMWQAEVAAGITWKF